MTAPSTGKLRKSVKTYRKMILTIPSGRNMSRAPEFKNAANYLRALYDEFGRQTVRRELQR